jgi:hypothetical protein
MGNSSIARLRIHSIVLLLVASSFCVATAFITGNRSSKDTCFRRNNVIPSIVFDRRCPTISQRWFYFRKQQCTIATTSSSLFLLLDVPDDFFTITFPVLGVLLSISKNFARIRMEERAWEQRLEEGRIEYLRRNPSFTELDLRRKEAAQEWSAYGVPRLVQEQQEATARRNSDQEQQWQGENRGRNRVSVLDRDVDDNEDFVGDTAEKKSKRIRKEDYCMTDEEIDLFEQEFGVAYDPYYDVPYTIDELPPGRCEIDKLYGDRIYPDGEIFYKDAKTGLFYRQGSKPRNLSFFG